MPISTADYAFLSHMVYEPGELGDILENAPSGDPYELVDKELNQFGYYGAVYENKRTNELVVAHRGTQPGEDLQDLVADAQMPVTRTNQQIFSARDLVERALQRAAADGGVRVTMTGHSLGGALAQIIAFEQGLYGETFNSYGAAGLYGVPSGGDQVINHIRATDMVAAAGTHFGQTKIYATEEDVELLIADPTLGSGSLWNLLELTPEVTHTPKQFYENSIITTDNEARYAREKTIYDLYRGQIWGAAHGLPAILPSIAASLPMGASAYTAFMLYLYGNYAGALAHQALLGTNGVDTKTGTEYADFMSGWTGADLLSGAGGDDIIMGDIGNDTLRGQAGNDYIVGGADDDFLDGGADNDRLEGGEGYDTYNFNASDFSQGSADTIRDSDDDGVITFEQVPFGNYIFENIWIDGAGWQTQDGLFRLQVLGQALIIVHNPTGGRILVENWSNGRMGITLPITGTPVAQNPLPQTAGNDLVGLDGEDAPGAPPKSGHDSIAGLAGNDGIDGGYGDDYIDGGDGDDLLLGGPGTNWLKGGIGNDILISDSTVMAWYRWDDSQYGTSQPLQDIYATMEARTDVATYGNGWYSHNVNGAVSPGDTEKLLTGLALNAWGFIDNDSQTDDIWVYLDPNLYKSGADELEGGDGDDIAYGGEGGDTIDGGAGKDLLVGGSDSDFVRGGADDDLILGDDLTAGYNIFVGFSQRTSSTADASGNDVLSGGEGNDRVYGLGGDDVIDGGDGNDVLSGDRLDYGLEHSIVQPVVSGNDYIDGGAGNDEIYGDGGNDTLLGGIGTDTIVGDTIAIDPVQHGNDNISGGGDADTIFGMGGNDVINGDDGADLLIGDANILDLAVQHHGDDVLNGGAGNDELQGGGGNDILDGGEDDDLLFGETGRDVLLGGAGNDELAGGEGDDSLEGGTGNDFLFGQAGGDALSGGSGDDELQGGDGNDYLDGGDGIDRLYGQAGADSLHGGADNDELQGGDANDSLDGGTGNDKLWGDAGDDTLNGGEGNDQLVGGEGNDTQNGGAGDDILNGNAGNDRLLGGAGNDNLSGNEQNDTVDGGAGNDFVGGDDGNDTVLGGAGVDTVLGGTGDDVLDGGAGNDTLDGGQGSDTFLFGIGSGNDVIVTYDSSSGRVDTIQLGAGITLADLIFVRPSENTLRIELSGSTDSVSFDGAFSPNPAIHQLRFDDGSVYTLDQIKVKLLETGASGDDDFIIGFGGADTIDGLAGNDHIEGRGGNDILRGGVGDDYLQGESGQDRLEGGDGNDTLVGDSKYGADLRYGEADTLIGGAGDDSITAGGGNDVLEGGAGKDHLTGDGGNDVLNGGTGDDDLSGRFNDDRLTGGLGNDHMNGGSGADTYVFGYGSGHDYIYEQNASPTYDDPISTSEIDTIEMDASVSPDDVTIQSDYFGYLYIRLQGSLDQITIANAFDYDGRIALGLIEQIRFSDGTVWDLATIKAKALVATEGDDVIGGFVEDENLVGLGGNDEIAGRLGNDHIDGGDGDDTLFGAVNDTLIGGDGNDFILAYAGDDVLNGGAGSDYMQGGYGNDSYLFGIGSGVDIVDNSDDGQGTDAVVMGAGLSADDVSLKRAGTNLLIEIIGTRDQLIVLDFFNTDQYAAHRQIDEIRFADDTVWDMTQIMARVVDTGTSMGVRFGGTYHGPFNGNDVLVDNGSQNSSINGFDGNDFLDGGTKADLLKGGLGDDRYAFGRGYGNDVVQAEQMGEANGFDVVEIGAGLDPSDLVVGRNGDDLIIGIDGTEDALTVLEFFTDHAGSNYLIDEVRFAAGAVWDSAYLMAHAQNLDQTVNGTTSDDIIAGGFGNDELQGGAGNDTITGNIGSDQLHGGDGNDMLRGGVGNDVLSGGLGSDTYSYSRGDGMDRIEEGTGSTGDIDVLKFGPEIGWSSEIQITRSAENGSILVWVNEEKIELSVDASGESLVEQLYFERDGTYMQIIPPQEAYLNLAFAYVLPPSFFQADPGVDLSITINFLPDWMEYDSATGTLTGIPTESVDDYVSISAVHSSGKVVTARFDLTVMNYINGTEGNDSLNGTSSNDAIFGHGGNDTINGLGGADRMVGGLGDDTYVVNNESDLAVELAGEGNDLVNSSVYYKLGANVERLTLTGQAESGEGNDLANTLTGNSLENWLSGYGGNDTIDGKSGADYMEGGLGDDSYVVDNVDDAVYEEAGEGYDSVSSSVSYTLSEEVEKLTLTGSSTLSATGNAADNVLVGNSGANTITGHAGNDTLDGKSGADTLIGGVGDDTYVVDNTNDSVQEIAGEGIDSVQSSIAHTLANNVENLTITGTGTLAGTGNTLDNVLVGGSGANALSGLAGNDTLEGKAGTDTLTGGAGNDTYVTARTYGTDTVVENDATAGVVDVARFLSGVTYDQLWFKRPSSSNNLEITIIGTTDKLVLKDWYLGTQYRVEEIRTVDGNKVLQAANVQALVTAMAGMTQPPQGQTTLTPAQQATLAPVFASTWQNQTLMLGGAGPVMTGGNQQSLVTEQGGIALQTEGSPTPAPSAVTPRAPGQSGSNVAAPPASVDSGETGQHAPLTDAYALQRQQRQRERYLAKYEMAGAENIAELESLIAAMASFSPGMSMSDALPADNAHRHSMLMASPL